MRCDTFRWWKDTDRRRKTGTKEGGLTGGRDTREGPLTTSAVCLYAYNVYYVKKSMGGDSTPSIATSENPYGAAVRWITARFCVIAILRPHANPRRVAYSANGRANLCTNKAAPPHRGTLARTRTDTRNRIPTTRHPAKRPPRTNPCRLDRLDY